MCGQEMFNRSVFVVTIPDSEIGMGLAGRQPSVSAASAGSPTLNM